MITKMKKVTIIIPCYNEEKGVGKVIDSIPVDKMVKHNYKTEIIVVDNNSSDNTVAIAESRSVRVIKEKRQGKGIAIKTGFEKVTEDTTYIVMLDGDNTYKGYEILRML